ncbi:LamG domain-containing protein [Flavobacterium sp. 5]|uniref:LamG domain-containing protein n=1 Tax=Flavobacterium sp. 5 TaxID=2035199 RepID=UPI000C2CBFFC|nr:LamG domain-containing protein [Flavobacterium sp. 5]PKB15035.1 concanavalin A-like lectin/glucanase superfamily protein [Flavobacterium sp. 5]
MKKIILLTVMLVFSFQVNAQTAIQEFNFNGTLSNTANDISFSGVAKFVKDRTGIANNAIRVTNTILEATIVNLPVSNSQRTVSIWVKYNDVATANYIWGYGSLTNAQYFGLLQQSTTTSKSDLNLACWGPSNDVIVTTTIASGTWYNYVVTYDGLTSKIYRNGELIKSSISSRKLTSAVVFGIGKIGSTVSINADLDDLKIYNVALSADEIATLYNNSSILSPNDAIASVSNSSKVIVKKVAKTNSTAKSNVVLSTPVETINSRISEIYSTQGLKVFTGDKNEIDIRTLPEGTYLLKVTNLEGAKAKSLTSN